MIKCLDYYIEHFMIKIIIEKIYQCILIKLFPDYYEFKTIERTSSTGSFIEYSTDED